MVILRRQVSESNSQQVSFHSRVKSNEFIGANPVEDNSQTESTDNIVSGVFAHILGIDPKPRPILHHELDSFGDSFSQIVLLAGGLPMTLRELQEQLESTDELVNRNVFLVAEGGQFNLNTPQFSVNARLVFSWRKQGSAAPDVLLSTVPLANSSFSLLQLASWSAKDGVYHFFERMNGDKWIWVGHSRFAFDPRTRGRGLFDGHINGSLVMKELKRPWVHWESQSATIPREVFENEGELDSEPLFQEITGAQILEQQIISGVRQVTKNRIKRDLADNENTLMPTYTRQIVNSTTVNLVSSFTKFGELIHQPMILPASFFLNIDVISELVLQIDFMADVIPSSNISIDGTLYLKAIVALNMSVESHDMAISIQGDTHFPFVVPERAFEDNVIINEFAQQNIFSPRLLLCIIMVDFHNPIISNLRASLENYFPPSLTIRNADTEFIEAIEESVNSTMPGSAEFEFLRYFNDPSLLSTIQKELALFFNGLQSTVATQLGVERLLILAEHRRGFFKATGGLSEFSSTLSELGMNIDLSSVSIERDGTINLG